jgi:hypothetical protein
MGKKASIEATRIKTLNFGRKPLEQSEVPCMSLLLSAKR